MKPTIQHPCQKNIGILFYYLWSRDYANGEHLLVYPCIRSYQSVSFEKWLGTMKRSMHAVVANSHLRLLGCNCRKMLG